MLFQNYRPPHTLRNGRMPIECARFNQGVSELWLRFFGTKRMSRYQSDHESKAATDDSQDNKQAIGMPEPNDESLSIVGIVTTACTTAFVPASGGRCGFAAKTGIHRCGFRTGIRGVCGARDRSCRCGYRACDGYIHPCWLLSSAGIVRAAGSLAAGIVARARSNTLVAIFLAFVVWNGEGIFWCVWLLPVAADADVGQSFLCLLLASLCTGEMSCAYRRTVILLWQRLHPRDLQAQKRASALLVATPFLYCRGSASACIYCGHHIDLWWYRPRFLGWWSENHRAWKKLQEAV